MPSCRRGRRRGLAVQRAWSAEDPLRAARLEGVRSRTELPLRPRKPRRGGRSARRAKGAPGETMSNGLQGRASASSGGERGARSAAAPDWGKEIRGHLDADSGRFAARASPGPQASCCTRAFLGMSGLCALPAYGAALTARLPSRIGSCNALHDPQTLARPGHAPKGPRREARRTAP